MKAIRHYTIIFICISVIIIGCHKRDANALFESLPPSSTGVEFINEVTETEELNILNYMYMYNGGGVGLGDFNNDGLVDIFFISNQRSDRMYLNRGSLEFDDISSQAGIGGEAGAHKWKTGVTLADINHDGWLDLYVCEIDSVAGFQGKNRLYINNKDLTFSERAKDFGLDVSGLCQHSVFFDFDLDGDLDMYLVNQSVHSVDSYTRSENRNRRTGKAADRLFRNDDGKFLDVSGSAGIFGSALGYGLAVSAGDLNNDNWPDLYVSNDFHENDYLYYNDGDGTFTENVVGSMGHVSTFSMGNDIADIDNDGLLDVLTLDMRSPEETTRKASSGADNYQMYNFKLNFGFHYQYPRNMLQFNEGHLFGGGNAVQFSELGEMAGVSSTDWSWGALVADFDNDGWKDIVVTNGILRRPNDLDFIRFNNQFPGKADSLSQLDLISKLPSGIVSKVAFQNSGGRNFRDVSDTWGINSKGISQGAAFADLDNDGDLDVVINNFNQYSEILENRSNELCNKRYLTVHLVGGALNPNGLGARVTVYSGGSMQILEKSSTRGWLSSSNNDLLFGLGMKVSVDSLIVDWGVNTQTLREITTDRTVVLKYADAIAGAGVVSQTTLIENCGETSGITFEHQENNFIDFSIERLMPRMLSREGAKVAVADINKDGLEDFFISGAKGQAGQLYIQTKNADQKFLLTVQPDLDMHRASETVGCAFADIDLDGDQDLYVVSGGSEPEKGTVMLDRIYVNNGFGKFIYQEQRLPNKMVNGSCVVPGDFNNDGAVDFFVGGRSTPTEYGLPGISTLYINDRRGIFADSSSYLGIASGRIGMVTDATWLEDERKLIVVGEWMPVTIYDFNQWPPEKSTIPLSRGLWNCIYADDLNNDGKVDLLLGNLGMNTILSASSAQPLELYVSDFDGNSSYDPLISFYNQNKKWPFSTLDELAAQLPTIRRRYISHTKFSQDDFSKVFPANVVEDAVHHVVETVESSVLMNSDSGFSMASLPKELQVSSIFGFVSVDIDGDRFKDILAVGNFEGNQPSIGKQDASFGHLLLGRPDGTFVPLRSATSGFAVYGDARDIAILKGCDTIMVLVSRNNAAPRLFQVRKPNQSGNKLLSNK